MVKTETNVDNKWEAKRVAHDNVTTKINFTPPPK